MWPTCWLWSKHGNFFPMVFVARLNGEPLLLGSGSIEWSHC